jgi:hypothetical protein
MATQRSSYTLRQLLARVQGDAGLRGQALYTIDDAARWGNRAQNRIARDTKWYRKSGTLGTTSGTKTGDWPTDFLSLSQMYYDGQPLRMTTERELSIYNYDWRNEGTGTPTWVYPFGFAGYGLHSTPDTTDVDILSIHYAALPPAVSDPDDTFYVPAGLEEAIECFVNLQAAIKDATGEGRERVGIYQREWQVWETEINSFVNSLAEGSIIVLGSDNLSAGVDTFDPFWNATVT